jgi:hypothetical protein
MRSQVKPEAFFDSLSLAHKLDSLLDGFRLEEIHLFSYFASILFLYRGNPVAMWQYKYIVDTNGYPFSDEINEALTRHIQNGLIENKGEFYSITARGTDEFTNFKAFPTLSKREEYLNAACTTTILVPYSQTIRALLNDSEIAKVKALQNKSWLDQSNVYQKFEEISKAIGVPAKDLIIPAVTWVNFISEQENLKQNA